MGGPGKPSKKKERASVVDAIPGPLGESGDRRADAAVVDVVDQRHARGARRFRFLRGANGRREGVERRRFGRARRDVGKRFGCGDELVLLHAEASQLRGERIFRAENKIRGSDYGARMSNIKRGVEIKYTIGTISGVGPPLGVNPSFSIKRVGLLVGIGVVLSCASVSLKVSFPGPFASLGPKR